LSEWRIPLSDLDYDNAEKEAVLRVLQSKWLSMGSEVAAFEDEFAARIGTKHAIAVANGTAALHLALEALGLKRGDEVVQPAINFVAAANMTLAAGAVPVFGDIVGIGEPTIDPAQVRSRITPKTKAVLVMHYGGHLTRMSEILDICRQHELALIEDACHAVGAHYVDPARKSKDKMAGSIGDIGCFSFFSNKNLAVGEGGMITTNRDDLAALIRLLRSHGMTSLTWDRHCGHAQNYDVLVNGYNYRLDEMHAALGRAQLAKLDENNRRRKNLSAIYRDELSGIEGCSFAFADYSGDSACHLAVLVVSDPAHKAGVIQALKEARIQTSLHYPYIPWFKAFKAFQKEDLPNSIAFSQRAVTLPLYPDMTPEDVKGICSTIRQRLGSERSCSD